MKTKGGPKRNICIYNIVYVVYRTTVDEWSGRMFGGVTSWTPPFPCGVGVDVPEPSPRLFLIVKIQHYGDWEDPACDTIDYVT